MQNLGVKQRFKPFDSVYLKKIIQNAAKDLSTTIFTSPTLLQPKVEIIQMYNDSRIVKYGISLYSHLQLSV